VEADEDLASAIVGEPGPVVEAEGLIFPPGQQCPTDALGFQEVSESSRQGQSKILFPK
jgi:hypothetical protein